MYKSISIVYFNNPQNPSSLNIERLLLESSGLDSEKIEIIRFDALINNSLSGVYNEGLKKSNSNIILFIESSLTEISNNWGIEIINNFNQTDFGILGLAGSTKIAYEKNNEFWFKNWKSNLNTSVGSLTSLGINGNIVNYKFSNIFNFIIPVVTVHGSFIAVHKERIQSMFNEDFKGTSFYDISFCIQNHINKVRIGVIANDSIKIVSRIYDLEQEINRDLFSSKFSHIYDVPTEIDIPVTNFCLNNSHTRRVHVIIPTKDKIDLIIQCLDSILQHTTYSNYYVWIADTGSNQENLNILKTKLNDLNSGGNNIVRFNLIEFDYYNYSKINNKVVEAIESHFDSVLEDIIVFCNNDIKLLNDCITGCLLEYEKLESQGINVGTLGIRLHFANNTIQHCGIAIHKFKDRISLTHNSIRASYNYEKNARACLGNTAAFMATRLGVFKEIGSFNENYIDTCQDVEYNMECIVRGYSNFYLDHLVAYHFESQTRNDDFEKTDKQNLDWGKTLFPYIIRNLKKIEPFFMDVNAKDNLS